MSRRIKITRLMVSLSMGRYRILFLATVLCLLGWQSPPSLGGQELPWLRGGQVRIDLAPSFWAWDSRYGFRGGQSGSLVEETEPVGLELNASPLGSGPIPLLRDLEADLRDALQDESFAVRLGNSRAIIEKSRLTFPVRMDLGITDWLSIGAMVPFHRPRTEISFFLDADSTNANVGLSPQLTNAGQVAQFISQFEAVLDAGQGSSPNDPQLLEARAFLTTLASAYSRSSMFPVVGSMAGTDLQARLDEIRAGLEAQGFMGTPSEVPLAENYLDQEGFDGFLASRGMQAAPLEDWTHLWSVGDVEITASARVLHHGFEPDSAGNLPALRYQVGVGALLRLGTGSQADPNRFFDLDPADGQTDLEGSLFGLLEIGRWLGGWGRVRYGIQQEGTVIRRIAAPSEVLPSVYHRVPLNWTPGDYLDLELNPRFYLTPEMTFGLRYHFWHKHYDSYSLGDIDPEILESLHLPSTDLLELETQQILHEVAVSASYSTLSAAGRGESPIPMVVRAVYYRPVAGSGGRTPKGGRLQVGISLFRTLWGGGGGSAERDTAEGR